MDLSRVKSFPIPRKRRKRVGCGPGSGHGKTSTRGEKGQKARTGVSFRRPFEGGQMPLFRRTPKRGFSNFDFRPKTAILNVEDLSGFKAGQVVDAKALEEAGLLKRSCDAVKILGGGDLKVALTVKASAFSASAKEKIEKAGGKAEVAGA